MFLQVWDAFKKQRIVPEHDVIKEHQVLMNLTHVSHVGNYRQPEFAREQAYGDEFGNSGNASAIDLHEVHRTGLHHVLEHDAVGNMLTKGNSSRRNRIREFLVGADIVWMGRFLHEIR